MPLFKAGSETDIGNYRPISILPVLSKVYEKLVYQQLYDFLSRKNILTDQQFGFRTGVTTSNALVSLTRFIYDELDSGNYVFSMMVDFRKAFDCVCHSILLDKLHHYGVRGTAHMFFASYLSNRQQFVRLGNCDSATYWLAVGINC